MNFKKFFWILFGSVLLLATVTFSAAFLRYQSWVSDSKPAEKLTSYFERITKSDFRYESMNWKLMPFPVVRFSQPVFKFKSDLKHELAADSLDLKLDLFKLILGDFGFSGLRLRNGTWKGQLEAPKGIHNFLVERIDLKTSALESNKPVKIYMSGDAAGRHKAVILHGELTLPPIEDPSLNSLGFQVQLLTRNFRFKGTPEWEFLGWVPSSGPSDFLIVLRRDPKSDRILFSGDAGLRELVFQNTDSVVLEQHKAGNLQLKFAGHFSPSTDELKFNQCSADLPFSKFNLQGTYLPHRREFRALTFNFSDVKLDDLITYFPDLKNKVPYFIGFSGMADLSASLNGFANRLKIAGDFDFTRTLFTYGRFFQKPKEKSLRLKTDFEWAGKVLAGEFSGNFENINFKGSLSEWRSSGEMKLNFITNSFAAEQLTGVIPFLTDYEFGGNMKLFGDWKGNFADSQPFERMFHLTMQEGRILRKGTGAGFKDMDLSLDLSPMQTDAQSVKFALGGSSFELSMKGLHPENNPKWEGTLKSEKLIAGQAWKEWTAFWGGEHEAWIQRQHTWIRRLILSEEPFENLKMKLSFGGGELDVSAIESKAFDGVLTGAFYSRVSSQDQKIRVQLQGADMSADKFFRFSGASAADLEGRLKWSADFNGARRDDTEDMNWDGPFSLSVENGRLNNFDWISALQKIEPFKEASREGVSSEITFNELNASGRIANDRLTAEKIQLDGDVLKVEGEGEVSREGDLNLRLETRIDSAVFRRLFPKRADDFVSSGDAFFGPVTLLASGAFGQLAVKPDPQSIVDLVSQYARKKTESISRYL
ncbi:MAG TPA: AsmA-like C-terminal region-containing protein [Candidatus Omnitrophota bacterium]|nr:AsmA-like C-terminal region-containing protein [Candidatus Omnitrophota bacterium]